jgi:aspartate beta-hydroxylase
MSDPTIFKPMKRDGIGSGANSACARLALRFDVAELVKAYRATRDRYALATHVAGHDGKSYHDGWTGVSLRSNGGAWNFAGPGRPSAAPFRDTEVMTTVPAWAQVVAAFPCTKESVRLSVLGPHGTIVPHCDEHIGFRLGRIRLHVPIVTSREVVMTIGGHVCEWRPGEVWFGDFSQTHTVVNGGAEERAHLVLDAQLSDELLRLFPPEFLAGQPAIAVFPRSRAVSGLELAAARCRFLVPRGSAASDRLVENLLPAERAIFARPDQAEESLRAELAVIDSELVLCLNERPVFALEPIGDGRFRLCGWPLHVELRVELEGSPARATRVAFVGDETAATWETLDARGDTKSRGDRTGAVRALEG